MKSKEELITLCYTFSFPRITFNFILKGVDEMEFKIEKKEAFDVIGFKRRMSEENNAHLQGIGHYLVTNKRII